MTDALGPPIRKKPEEKPEWVEDPNRKHLFRNRVTGKMKYEPPTPPPPWVPKQS